MAICLKQIVNRLGRGGSLFTQGRNLASIQLTSNQPKTEINQSIIPIEVLAPVNAGNKIFSQNTILKYATQPKDSEHIVLSESQNTNQSEKSSNSDLPEVEDLEHAFETLKHDLPRLFTDAFDYRIYHKDIIFENNILNKKTVGMLPYVKQVAMLKIWGHFKFAYVRFEILKATMHPKDGTVKIRWRVRGISGLKVFITFWKYRIWDIKEMFERQEAWIDGFSTFYLGGDGLIYKHVADKVIPDEDREPVIPTAAVGGLSASPKMAIFIGLSSELAPITIESISF